MNQNFPFNRCVFQNNREPLKNVSVVGHVRAETGMKPIELKILSPIENTPTTTEITRPVQAVAKYFDDGMMSVDDISLEFVGI